MKRLVLSVALSFATQLVANAGEFFSEAVSNTATQLSAVPCRLVSYKVINRDLTNRVFVHIYDALSANVTVGSTQQVDLIAVPANGAAVFHSNGSTILSLRTGLTISVTTGPLSTDNTAPAMPAVVEIVY